MLTGRDPIPSPTFFGGDLSDDRRCRRSGARGLGSVEHLGSDLDKQLAHRMIWPPTRKPLSTKKRSTASWPSLVAAKKTPTGQDCSLGARQARQTSGSERGSTSPRRPRAPVPGRALSKMRAGTVLQWRQGALLRPSRNYQQRCSSNQLDGRMDGPMRVALWAFLPQCTANVGDGVICVEGSRGHPSMQFRCSPKS